MGDVILKDPALWLSQLDLTPHTSALALSIEHAMKDNTKVDDDTIIEKGGFQMVDWGLSGFIDTGAGLVDERLFTDLGLDGKVIAYGAPENAGAENTPMYFFKGTQARYVGAYEVGEFNKFEAGGRGSGRVVRGVPIHNALATADEVTGNGTNYNVGAVAADEFLYAAILIFDVQGTSTPTLTPKLQSDVDGVFATPTDQITFAAQTAVGSVFATRVAGPITDSFWRADFAISGTAPQFKWAMLMAIDRG